MNWDGLFGKMNRVLRVNTVDFFGSIRAYSLYIPWLLALLDALRINRLFLDFKAQSSPRPVDLNQVGSKLLAWLSKKCRLVLLIQIDIQIPDYFTISNIEPLMAVNFEVNLTVLSKLATE